MKNKTNKKKFNKKKFLTFGMLSIFALALVSAGLLVYYGQIHQTVDVKQAVTLDGVNCSDNICNENVEDVYAPDTRISGLYTLTNKDPENSRNVELITEPNNDEITTRYVEYFDNAGANLDNYVAPTNCNVNVTSSQTIQSVINSASEGAVVCVEARNYNEDLTINKPLTLVSMDGADSTTIQGTSGSSKAVKITSSNITIKGFTIKDYGLAGIWVEGNITGVNIEDNVINGTGNEGSSGDSIYIRDGATVTITNNDLGNNQLGRDAYRNNDWSVSAGISVHSDTVTATYNNIYNNDFGIHSKSGSTVNANYNNIENSKIADFFYEKTSDTTTVLNATNDYWGTDGIQIEAGDSTGLIDVDSYIDASWMTKTDLELIPSEVDGFGIINDFKLSNTSYTGTITTSVKPVVD